MTHEIDWAAAERLANALPPAHLSCGCIIGGPEERRCAKARALDAESRNASDLDAAVCILRRKAEHIARGMR